MSKKATLLSIVVPDYNEEHTIGDVIDRLKATLQETGLDSEIIVVDDHSRDRSAEISLGKHVTVYSLKQHMGKGFALMGLGRVEEALQLPGFAARLKELV